MKTPKIRSKCGFTLIELLVVIVIIAILMGITLGVASLAMRKSSDAQAVSEMQLLSNYLEEHRVLAGSYPIALDDMINTKSVLPDNVISRIIEEFSSEDPDTNPSSIPWSDPWGQSYIYNKESRYAFSLKSKGRDTVVDTEDDIISGKQ